MTLKRVPPGTHPISVGRTLAPFQNVALADSQVTRRNGLRSDERRGAYEELRAAARLNRVRGAAHLRGVTADLCAGPVNVTAPAPERTLWAWVMADCTCGSLNGTLKVWSY